MISCGPAIALYGGNPTPGRSNPMRPVVGLEGARSSRSARSRTARPSATTRSGPPAAGGGSPSCRSATRTATSGPPARTDAKLRDGVPAGEAIVAGRRCPFAGRVSMDLIAVDVTDVAETAVERGDLVTLIGGDLTVDEVGRRAGTIGYEILTGLGRRYARIYRNGNS